MNRTVMDFLTRKMRDNRRSDYRRGRDNRDMRDMRDNRDRRDYRDYNDSYDYEDSRDYRDNRDNRRGRDNRDYEDSRDYNDYDERDYNDYNDKLKLTKADMMQWKKMLQNADGTHGEHYDMEQIMQAAEKMNVRFNNFSEKELCMTVNMLYSDYCRLVKKYIPPEKELQFYIEMAKAFLDDEDGPEPSEKLALYFHCISNA